MKGFFRTTSSYAWKEKDSNNETWVAPFEVLEVWTSYYRCLDVILQRTQLWNVPFSYWNSRRTFANWWHDIVKDYDARSSRSIWSFELHLFNLDLSILMWWWEGEDYNENLQTDFRKSSSFKDEWYLLRREVRSWSGFKQAQTWRFQ